MSKKRIILICLFGFMQGLVVTNYNHQRKINDIHKILTNNQNLNKQEVIRIIQTEGYKTALEYVDEMKYTYDSIYNY